MSKDKEQDAAKNEPVDQADDGMMDTGVLHEAPRPKGQKAEGDHE